MTKGDKRRSRRKYRVRYDRLVVLVLIFVVMGVLVSSCTKACSKDPDTGNGGKGSGGGTRNPSVSDADTTQPANSGEVPTENNAPVQDATTAEGEAPETAANTIEVAHEEIYKGDLVLVNADYEYKFPAGDIDTVALFQEKSGTYGAGDFVTELDRNVLAHLNAMIDAYAESRGVSSTEIFVQDGYRTYDQQVDRHSSGKSKTFEAGHTDYHTGRTFDMFLINNDGGSPFSYFSATGNCEWFAANAGEYGFIVRYPEGKQEQTGEKPRTYTYRYVGAPHASYINSNGLCLEEYIAAVQKHTKDDPLTMSANGHNYSVYYVEAKEEGSTSVDVPADKPYTFSGDNGGGFIVTVTLD